MRLMSVLSATLLISASAAALQTGNDYQTISRALVADGRSALAQSDGATAQRLFERALVANPANVTALVGLGRAHEAQGAVPVSLKYYRRALDVEPNNLDALEAQALAFLKRDLFDEAELNRDKLKRLCRAGCSALDTVESAIAGYVAADAPADLATEGQGR